MVELDVGPELEAVEDVDPVLEGELEADVEPVVEPEPDPGAAESSAPSTAVVPESSDAASPAPDSAGPRIPVSSPVADDESGSVMNVPPSETSVVASACAAGIVGPPASSPPGPSLAPLPLAHAASSAERMATNPRPPHGLMPSNVASRDPPRTDKPGRRLVTPGTVRRAPATNNTCAWKRSSGARCQ